MCIRVYGYYAGGVAGLLGLVCGSGFWVVCNRKTIFLFFSFRVCDYVGGLLAIAVCERVGIVVPTRFVAYNVTLSLLRMLGCIQRSGKELHPPWVEWSLGVNFCSVLFVHSSRS
jgi:hypothetical protein